MAIKQVVFSLGKTRELLSLSTDQLHKIAIQFGMCTHYHNDIFREFSEEEVYLCAFYLLLINKVGFGDALSQEHTRDIRSMLDDERNNAEWDYPETFLELLGAVGKMQPGEYFVSYDSATNKGPDGVAHFIVDLLRLYDATFGT